VLNGRYELHDPACRGRRCVKGGIRDVEQLCGEALERRGITLGHSNYEDRLAFAISECWILAGKYEPAKDGARKNMAAWVFFRLGQRLVDAERAEHRTVWRFKDYVHVRARPEFVPLEPELERIDGTWAGDPARDRDPDLARLLAARGGQLARDLDELGIEAPRRVA
jgi:hypothetical protein